MLESAIKRSDVINVVATTTNTTCHIPHAYPLLHEVAFRLTSHRTAAAAAAGARYPGRKHLFKLSGGVCDRCISVMFATPKSAMTASSNWNRPAVICSRPSEPLPYPSALPPSWLSSRPPTSAVRGRVHERRHEMMLWVGVGKERFFLYVTIGHNSYDCRKCLCNRLFTKGSRF